jgi:hypothetical protein
VFEGDHRALFRFAPISYWLRRLGPKLLISCAFAWWIAAKLTSDFTRLPDPATKFTDLLVSIFPNLLGFGIGVYALIFALPESFFQSLRGEKKRNDEHSLDSASEVATQHNESTPPNMINADMAYPLLVMAVSIMYGAFAQFFVDFKIFCVSIFLLTYCFVLMLELISLIYFSAYKTISDKRR